MLREPRVERSHTAQCEITVERRTGDAETVRPPRELVAERGVSRDDGTADDYVVGVTSNGRLYRLARNAHNDVEFAGACFSPDGGTLFVNIQDPGITFAIWGPWSGREA